MKRLFSAIIWIVVFLVFVFIIRVMQSFGIDNYVSLAIDNYLGPILFVILGAVTLLSSAVALLSLKTYRNVLTNHDIDVSSQNRPIPPRLYNIVAPLIERGFVRLGEYATVSGEKELGAAWCYLDPARQTMLEITDTHHFPLMQFSTMYSDNALLETMYPRGETINDPDYRVQTVTTRDLWEAYQQHLNNLTLFTTHGDPISIRDMAHSLELGHIARLHYGQRKLRRLMRQAFVIPLFFGLFTLMIGLMSFGDRILSDDLQMPVAIGMVGLAFMLVPLLFSAPGNAAKIYWAGLGTLLVLLPLFHSSLTYILIFMTGLCILVLYYLFMSRSNILPRIIPPSGPKKDRSYMDIYSKDPEA